MMSEMQLFDKLRTDLVVRPAFLWTKSVDYSLGIFKLLTIKRESAKTITRIIAGFMAV